MVPEDFGPYRLEALLGRGGMGEVFRAFDNEHGRLVALKRLALHLADDPEFQGRFRREARLAAKLRNPHIVPIHRFGELDGHLFIDMRYVDGYDVAELIDTVGPLEPHRAVSIIEQVGSALATAHAAGLVHRDVKPSNLLVDLENSQDDRDFVFLADFGISRPTAAAPTHSLTRTGALLGSIAYMAPEQFDGMADSRSDIYAMTCVLFELLTGSKPYRGAGLPAMMHAHINIPPPLPSTSRTDLPAGIDDVIRRGMAKEPVDRYGSTTELVRAARSALLDQDEAGVRQQAVNVLYGAHKKSQEAARILRHRENGKTASPDARHALRESWPPIENVDDETLDDRTSDRAGDIPETEPTTPMGSTPSRPIHPDRSERAAADTTDDVRTSTIASAGGTNGPRRRVVAIVASVLTVVLIGGLVLVLSRPPTTTSGAPGLPRVETPTVTQSAQAAPVSTGTPSVEAKIAVGQGPQGVALSPDGGTIYVADRAGRSLAVVDVAARTVRSTMALPGTPQYAAVSRDGRRVFVSMFDDNGSGSGVAVVDVPAAAVAKVLTPGPRPYALATAPDGRIFVPIHDAARIDVIDPTSLQTVASVGVSRNPHAVAFSPTGDVAYAADHESDEVGVIDTATGKMTTTIPVGRGPHSVAVSPDGTEIASANYAEGSISIIAAATHAVVRTYPVGKTPQSVAYSADGRYLYTSNEEADQVATLDAHTGQVTTLSVGASPRFVVGTPDGVHLVVASNNAREIALLRTAR